MSYILVTGVDKLSVGSFMSFVSNYFKKYKIGVPNFYMSEESLHLFLDDFAKNASEGILSYYMKRKLNSDPLTCLPKRLIEIADVIVWFDLYSTLPLVLKEVPDGFFKTIIEDWNKYITRIS